MAIGSGKPPMIDERFCDVPMLEISDFPVETPRDQTLRVVNAIKLARISNILRFYNF